MDNKDVNYSLLVRTVNNMYELLDRLLLEPDYNKVKLSKFNEDELKRGISKFREVMVLISNNNKLKKGYGFNIPFVIYIEGNA